MWALVGLSVGIGFEVLFKKGPELRTLPDKEAADVTMRALGGSLDGRTDGTIERDLLKNPVTDPRMFPSVMAEIRVRLAKRGVKLTASQEKQLLSLLPTIATGVV